MRKVLLSRLRSPYTQSDMRKRKAILAAAAAFLAAPTAALRTPSTSIATSSTAAAAASSQRTPK